MTVSVGRISRKTLLLTLVTSMMLGFTSSVQAVPVITVETTQDIIGSASSPCSLRAAVIAANLDQNFGGCKANPGSDSIYVPEGTYTLGITGVDENGSLTGDIDIATNTSIYGAGADVTFIDGAVLDRVFDIRSANSVLIANLTIRIGKAPIGSP